LNPARFAACLLPGALILLLAGVAVRPARADAAHDVTVSDVWARATPAGARFGAIYLTLASAAGDSLVGAAVPHAVAGRTQIHETVMVPDSSGAGAGRMAMREVPGIALPAGQAVQLAPGGYHVMLLDLKRPLKAGMRVPLALRFARAGKRDVVARVRGE